MPCMSSADSVLPGLTVELFASRLDHTVGQRHSGFKALKHPEVVVQSDECHETRDRQHGLVFNRDLRAAEPEKNRSGCKGCDAER